MDYVNMPKDDFSGESIQILSPSTMTYEITVDDTNGAGNQVGSLPSRPVKIINSSTDTDVYYNSGNDGMTITTGTGSNLLKAGSFDYISLNKGAPGFATYQYLKFKTKSGSAQVNVEVKT